jgi:branched-chain amino acid transport system ATP-binding protein
VSSILNEGGTHVRQLDPPLQVNELTRRFGGLAVLSGVTFTVPPNAFFGIVGPNGAGKTTLLNIISGFDAPDDGHVRIAGVNATGFPAHRIADLGVARTFQNVRLFSGLTVVEQVISGSWRRRGVGPVCNFLGTRSAKDEKAAQREAAHELLTMVGLESRANQLVDVLSYGDRRRVEVARALASNPHLLLLDEPTAGMNFVEWGRLGEIFERVRDEGTTLVFVEHNMRFVRRHCSHVVVLNSGSIIAEGPPADCLEDPLVREAYFGT